VWPTASGAGQRAIRLLVDTGLRSKDWSREQVISYKLVAPVGRPTWPTALLLALAAARAAAAAPTTTTGIAAT
jgi:hypothetical protein